MINVINSWAQGIVLAVIISTLIEIILPEGNNKKYIKTIIGIYILFVIVEPLASRISNKNININSIMQNTSKKMNEYKTEDLKLETNKYIEETYTNKIKEDITEKIKSKGFNITSIYLNLELEDEQMYGEIKSINIKISRIEDIDKEENVTENEIKNINNVEINLSNEPILDEENISKEILQDEIEKLKEYLNSEYGTAKEKIYINE